MLINMPSTPIHIPTHLIIEQHTSPLVLGIYTLIGRLVLFQKRAIELSQADIMAYDTMVARGPVVRALEKLRRGQWILGGKSEQGGKTTYFPTWGTIAGKTIPWNPTDESPTESVTTIKVHSQLLDEYIGVMVPHHYGVVLVERVHEQPLLHLHDIGVYLKALVGYPVSTPKLEENKLIIGDKVQLVPKLV